MRLVAQLGQASTAWLVQSRRVPSGLEYLVEYLVARWSLVGVRAVLYRGGCVTVSCVVGAPAGYTVRHCVCVPGAYLGCDGYVSWYG